MKWFSTQHFPSAHRGERFCARQPLNTKRVCSFWVTQFLINNNNYFPPPKATPQQRHATTIKIDHIISFLFFSPLKVKVQAVWLMTPVKHVTVFTQVGFRSMVSYLELSYRILAQLYCWKQFPSSSTWNSIKLYQWLQLSSSTSQEISFISMDSVLHKLHHSGVQRQLLSTSVTILHIQGNWSMHAIQISWFSQMPDNLIFKGLRALGHISKLLLEAPAFSPALVCKPITRFWKTLPKN